MNHCVVCVCVCARVCVCVWLIMRIVARIDVSSARLIFWDLGGQEDLQTLWDKVTYVPGLPLHLWLPIDIIHAGRLCVYSLAVLF